MGCTKLNLISISLLWRISSQKLLLNCPYKKKLIIDDSEIIYLDDGITINDDNDNMNYDGIVGLLHIKKFYTVEKNSDDDMHQKMIKDYDNNDLVDRIRFMDDE